MERTITKTQAYEMLARELKNKTKEMENKNDKYMLFYINGMTFYITDYNLFSFNDESNDFTISLYYKGELVCTYHSYEMDYLYFNFTLYRYI